jgi:hypothetical protein
VQKWLQDPEVFYGTVRLVWVAFGDVVRANGPRLQPEHEKIKGGET